MKNDENKQFTGLFVQIIIAQILCVALIIVGAVFDFGELVSGLFISIPATVLAALILFMFFCIVRWRFNKGADDMSAAQQNTAEEPAESVAQETLSEEQMRVISTVAQEHGLSAEDLIELARDLMEETENFLDSIEYCDTLDFIVAIIELLKLGFTAEDFYQ